MAAALTAAVAQQASAQAAFAGAKANFDVLQAQKLEAERTRAELVNSEEQAERDLSFTEICVLFDGVVGNRAVELGQYAQPGVRLLALVPMDSVYVDANFKETQLGEIPSRSEGRRRRGRLWRAGRRGRGQVDLAGLRRTVLAAAAGQRDGQFHQGRPAGRGSDKAVAGSDPGGRPACRPVRRRLGAHPRREPAQADVAGRARLRRRSQGRRQR